MSDDQFAKLFDRLDSIDSRLDDFDEHFARLDNRMDAFDGQFTRLFRHVEDFRTSVEERFERMDHEVADVRGGVAELSVRVENYHDEVLVLSHQFNELSERFG